MIISLKVLSGKVSWGDGILSIFIIWNVKLYIKGGGCLITWIIK